MDEDLARLEAEFCPPLDAALVITIYSDFEGQPNPLELARAVLAPFKDTAVVEQLTDFDPSGCSTQTKGDGASKSPIESDVTSLTNGVSSLDFSSSGSSTPSEPSATMAWLQNLDISVKEKQLVETFPTLKATTIAFVLNRNKGDYEKTTDELLNHAAFEEMDGQDGEEKVLRKGVDSFADDGTALRGRKAKANRKKNKKANYMNLDEYARSSSEPGPPQNKWRSLIEDVAFITSKANVSEKTVKSLYHESSGSVPATIAALIAANTKANPPSLEEESDITVQNVLDLSSEFSLDLPTSHALIRLTTPSSAAAHELAKALTRPVASTSSTPRPGGGIELIPHYAPLNLPSDDSNDSPTTSSLSTLPPSATPQTATTLLATRTTAFNHASTYHRLGKSSPLLRGAASYYAQLGRDASRAYRVAASAEADALVAAQSSSDQLDLHGVSVADAKRIAAESVRGWWEGLGERRVRGGRWEYRVVTGVGRHSEGGRARIGPAVVKMLVGEGWRVEVGSGVVTVTGRRG